MEYEDQREFYSCPLCGAGMGNDIDNEVHGTPEHHYENDTKLKMELIQIEALQMPNGEVLLNGKTIGWIKENDPNPAIKIVKRFDATNGEEIIT